jgi:hypothetical protein
LTNINTIKIDDNVFDIFASVNEDKIDIYVKAKSHNISIYEELAK